MAQPTTMRGCWRVVSYIIQPFNLHLDFWKSRSVSNIRKISGPAYLIFFSVHLSFFSVCHLSFFQVYGTNLKKIHVNWKKNQVCRTLIFQNLDFQKSRWRLNGRLSLVAHWFEHVKFWILNIVFFRQAQLTHPDQWATNDIRVEYEKWHFLRYHNTYNWFF